MMYEARERRLEKLLASSSAPLALIRVMKTLIFKIRVAFFLALLCVSAALSSTVQAQQQPGAPPTTTPPASAPSGNNPPQAYAARVFLRRCEHRAVRQRAANRCARARLKRSARYTRRANRAERTALYAGRPAGPWNNSSARDTAADAAGRSSRRRHLYSDFGQLAFRHYCAARDCRDSSRLPGVQPPASPPPPGRESVPTPAPDQLPPVPSVAPNFRANAQPFPELSRVGVDMTDQRPLSLREAIAMALANNKDIEVARQNVRIAEFDLQGSRGAYDPRLSSLSYYERINTPATSFLSGAIDGAVTQTDLHGHVSP